MHTSVAIRNKKRPGSFGVTPLGALDAVAASPPHPPDCSVPSPRRGIGALLQYPRRLTGRREDFTQCSDPVGVARLACQ